MRTLIVLVVGSLLLSACAKDRGAGSGAARRQPVKVSTGNTKATCAECKVSSPCTRPADVNNWVNAHTKEQPAHVRYNFEDCPK